jgi:hypothetical protein
MLASLLRRPLKVPLQCCHLQCCGVLQTCHASQMLSSSDMPPLKRPLWISSANPVPPPKTILPPACTSRVLTPYPFLPSTVEHLTALQIIGKHLYINHVKTESDHKNSERMGWKIWSNIDHTLYFRKPNPTSGVPIHYPVKASGDLKNCNCLFPALYLRQFFAKRFDKKRDLFLKVYKISCAKSNIDDLNRILDTRRWSYPAHLPVWLLYKQRHNYYLFMGRSWTLCILSTYMYKLYIHSKQHRKLQLMKCWQDILYSTYELRGCET